MWENLQNQAKIASKILEKNAKKVKNLFSSKTFLIHRSWSGVVSKHPQVPGNHFRPSYTPKTNFNFFLKGRNFDHKIHFWKVGCFTSLKNAFGRSTEKLICFSILLFKSNVNRGVKYGTISNFLSYGFVIQGLLLKKIHFLASSCEQSFKNMLKMLAKCLKKL